MEDEFLHLPEEILTLILSRLPVKSLLEFKSVSKYWLSLISSPQFEKAHLQFPAHYSVISEVDDNAELITSVSLPHPKINTYQGIEATTKKVPINDLFSNRQPLFIVGSCNGLVCLSDRSRGCFLIWNPATRKQSFIPYTCSLNIGHHHISFRAYGFGYDSCSNDYKIVVVTQPYGFEQYVEICNLKLELWKQVALANNVHIEDKDVYDVDSDLRDLIVVGTPGVFANGALHFMAKVPNHNKFTSVVAISMQETNEPCPLLALPNYKYSETYTNMKRSALVALNLEKADVDVNLGVSETEQSLYVAHVYKNQIDLWVLKEYGIKESWMKFAYVERFPFDYGTLGVTESVDYCPDNFHCVFHRVISRRGLLTLLCLENGEIFTKYYGRTKLGQVSLCVESDKLCDYYINFGFTIYKESLISLGQHRTKMEVDEIIVENISV